MFGHQDDRKNDDQPINDLLSQPALDGVLDDDHHDDFNPALPPADNQPQPSYGGSDDSTADTDESESVTEEAVQAPVDTPTRSVEGNEDLLKIKQQALDQLSPLVGHLEQSPEEKFRTTMMMIQANDNQDLIKVAYEAAQAISDEKVRAKALLDIVNEINYFTHQQHPDA